MNADAERALDRLIEGNRRYMAGEERPPEAQARRDDLADNGQRPFACVIGCSDSRSAPEIVFHQGIGDIFSVRTAGNTVCGATVASAEYAAEHLHVPLIVIMGHTFCGAVDAALNGGHGSAEMSDLLGRVRSSFGGRTDPRVCERLNVLAGMDELMRSDIINDLVLGGRLCIAAAVYDIRSGAVEFMKTIRSEHREVAGDPIDLRLLRGADTEAGDRAGLHLRASRICDEAGDDAACLRGLLEEEEVLFR